VRIVRESRLATSFVRQAGRDELEDPNAVQRP
jgi:hypothetical protein